MIEINALNVRLIGAMKNEMPELGYDVTREWLPSEFEGVPEDLKEEIRLMAERIGKAIPDDFGFTLSLGEEDGAMLSLDYDNGLMAGGFAGQEIDASRSLFEQLEGWDWDGHRAWFIQGSEFFDNIKEQAKELPAMMPSTKRVQKACREQMKEYIKEKRRDASRVHVLIWDGEEALYDEDFESLTAFQKRLIDIMPEMGHVVTVVADGKPLPVEKIDEFKQAALKELEEMPISHAKASGKFAHIMSQMDSAEEEPGEK